MTHPRAKGKELERESRRREVAAILLSGITNQTAIAEQLGVDQSTISRDISHVKKQWQVEAVQDIGEAKGKDLERTESLIVALWDKARNGDERAIAQVLNLMQHRAKLLGLNAPEKREDTHRIEVQHMVQQIAEWSGLDEAEILAEAERYIKAAQ